jgi:hypothetical protein
MTAQKATIQRSTFASTKGDGLLTISTEESTTKNISNSYRQQTPQLSKLAIVIIYAKKSFKLFQVIIYQYHT